MHLPWVTLFVIRGWFIFATAFFKPVLHSAFENEGVHEWLPLYRWHWCSLVIRFQTLESGDYSASYCSHIWPDFTGVGKMLCHSCSWISITLISQSLMVHCSQIVLWVFGEQHPVLGLSSPEFQYFKDTMLCETCIQVWLICGGEANLTAIHTTANEKQWTFWNKSKASAYTHTHMHYFKHIVIRGFIGFEVRTAVVMKNSTVWDVKAGGKQPHAFLLVSC